MTRQRRVFASIVCLTLLVAATACTKGGDPKSGPGPSEPTDKAASSNAVQRFGHAPTDDPHITYQPNVVRIGDGPEAIKHASEDGLQWTIDGDAPGAKDLALGKIMFASAMAVGRVVALKENGDDLDVLLAPAALTEVIRDGDLSIDQPLDLAGASFYSVPDRPGVSRDLEASATPTPARRPAPTFGPAAASAPMRIVAPALRMVPLAGGLPNPSSGQSTSVTVGEWKFTFNRSGGSGPIAVKANYAGKSGLKFVLNLELGMKDPRIKADMEIRGGVAKMAETWISGITAMKVKLDSGSANGLKDNQKILVELPVELAKMTIPIYGVPTVLKLGLKQSVTTGFSAKDSTLSTEAVIKLDGQVGAVGGSAGNATATLENDPLKTIKGTSVGASGVVFAQQWEVTWGLGIPSAMAGPSANLVFSFGVTNGSDLGIVKCRSITVKVTAGASIGITISTATAESIAKKLAELLGTPEWSDAVKEAADKLKIAQPKKEIASKDLINRTDWYPNTALCRAP